MDPTIHCMTWHGRPWDGMTHVGEVRERGAAIEGLKRGVEPCSAQTMKIAARKRRVKGP